MSDQKLFFHTNLRFLRERRKMSQEELSQQLGLARNKLQALESGKTQNPSAVDMVKFSEYFKVSVDTLLKVDLSKLGELKLRELLAGNDVYMTGTNVRILAITVDKENKENIEYVPVKAKAGYQAGYNDPDFIAELPKFSLPNLPKNGSYRMFPTTGDSMLPIPEGSDVICKYVEDWTSLKDSTPCIVILKGDQDFVFKLVTIVSTNKITLSSLNKLYEPYTVSGDEILEVWEFQGYQTYKLPQPETSIQEIKTLLIDLGKRIK